MALTRRSFVVGAPLLAGFELACSALPGQPAEGRRDALLFASHASRAGAPRVLVCMPETRQTLEVWRGLSDELGRDFELVALRVEGQRASETLVRGIQRYQPAGLVLMNNPTVLSYERVQAAAESASFPPAVIVMSSFLEGASSRLRAATGISYEVPLITMVTNLRKLIAAPIERVGVIHRPGFEGFIARQAALALREQTAVVREPVSQRPNTSELKRALRRLKQRCDAIWVLNDNGLLTPQLLADGWVPGLNERRWVPTIVGAASLVSPGQSFGTFAVLPDHTALGTQAASLILDIADNGWLLAAGTSIQLPLSTTTSVDLQQVRERFALRPGALSQVDKVLGQ